MPRYRIAFVNFPGDGKTAWQTSAWCTKTFMKMKTDERIGEVYPLYYGPDTPITMMRNRAVKDALELKCDYILFIDSDVSPDVRLGADPDAKPFWDVAWEFMMRRREACEGNRMPATIAAPYVGPPPAECVYIFLWKNFETGSPNPNYKLEMLEREHAATCAGIQEVAALPTGLILYDARVFNIISKPWFDYEWTDEFETNKASTEDVYQTRNASLCACPQFVAWDCWADHIKTKHCSKPQPWTVEVLSEKFHDTIKAGMTMKKRLTFLGDPEGRGAPSGEKNGPQVPDRLRDIPLERRHGVAHERVVPQDGPQDEVRSKDWVDLSDLSDRELPDQPPEKQSRLRGCLE